ncbi:MAG: hypothetical protein E7599_07370, partial [Ruminococcaceae bacterium]|nr:hypothetical protein [Oscillospiraceae bacterium]
MKKVLLLILPLVCSLTVLLTSNGHEQKDDAAKAPDSDISVEKPTVDNDKSNSTDSPDHTEKEPSDRLPNGEEKPDSDSGSNEEDDGEEAPPAQPQEPAPEPEPEPEPE